MFSMAFWKYEEDVYLDPKDTCKRLSNAEHVAGVAQLDVDQIKASLEELGRKIPCVDFCVFSTPQFIKVTFQDFYPPETMNLFPDLMVDYGCPVYHESNGKRLDEHPLSKGENYYI